MSQDSKPSLPQRLEAIAKRVAESEGMEVVEVQCKGSGNQRIVRIFLDKPGGVTLKDCEEVSTQVGTILDVEEVIPSRYTLEVSSPGLDRKLLKLKDYERFAGQKAKIRFRQAIDGQQHFTGTLLTVDEGRPGLHTPDGLDLRFGLEEVSLARLVVDLDLQLKKKR